MSTTITANERETAASLVDYLRGSDRVILRYLGDEYAGEVHPVTAENLAEALDDADMATRSPVRAATERLLAWELIRSRHVPVDGEQTTRYMLTDRGKAVVLEHGDVLDEAPAPVAEWDRGMWDSYPGDDVERFHLLVSEIQRLHERVED